MKELYTAGVVQAKFEFARLLLHGTGVAPNKVLAVLFLTDASEACYEQATFALNLIGEKELLEAAVLADLRNDVATAVKILGPLVRRNYSARAKYLLATLYERAGGAYFEEAVLLYAAASLENVEEATEYFRILTEQDKINRVLMIEALLDNPYSTTTIEHDV